jgi:hypothetical protein
MWRQCRFHLRSLHDHNVGIVDVQCLYIKVSVALPTIPRVTKLGDLVIMYETGDRN